MAHIALHIRISKSYIRGDSEDKIALGLDGGADYQQRKGPHSLILSYALTVIIRKIEVRVGSDTRSFNCGIEISLLHKKRISFNFRIEFRFSYHFENT